MYPGTENRSTQNLYMNGRGNIRGSQEVGTAQLSAEEPGNKMPGLCTVEGKFWSPKEEQRPVTGYNRALSGRNQPQLSACVIPAMGSVQYGEVRGG